MGEERNFEILHPCMTEDHEVYIAGRGYVKVKEPGGAPCFT